MKPRVCVLRTDGTNCDRETKYAFNEVGGDAEIVHLNSIIKGNDPAEKRRISLDDYDILTIPGGFSYGDYIAAGKILASDLEHFLQEELKEFVDSGKLVIGICNGFQVLVKYGLLPMSDGKVKQTTTLTYNDSGRFECRWVSLIKPRGSNGKCIWTKNIDKIDLPVAHGEGKFVIKGDLTDRLFEQGLVVFQYAYERGATMNYPENPNGSEHAIAGICDPTGLIFGLMPHPERYNHPMRHHLATLQKIKGTLPDHGLGLDIFRNGVDYFM